MSYEKMLTPAEVADALNLDVKTLARWAKGGVIDFLTLPTGHRRFPKAAVDAILAGTYVPPRDRVGFDLEDTDQR